MDNAKAANKIAILLPEMQPLIVQSISTMQEERLILNASVVVDLAAQLGITVIASAIEMDKGQPVELIVPLAKMTPVIRKTPGMLEDEKISEMIRSRDISVLAIGGVSSEIAVLHTALGALRQGYQVYVLADCCGGLSARTENAAFHQMEAAGATLSNISSFFSAMVAAMDDDVGQPVFAGLGRLWGWTA